MGLGGEYRIQLVHSNTQFFERRNEKYSKIVLSLSISKSCLLGKAFDGCFNREMANPKARVFNESRNSGVVSYAWRIENIVQYLYLRKGGKVIWTTTNYLV